MADLDLIEYAPNPTPRPGDMEMDIEIPPPPQLAPRIVYVCSLCLRQYDLLVDLRGHMVFYHNLQPAAPDKLNGMQQFEKQAAGHSAKKKVRLQASNALTGEDVKAALGVNDSLVASHVEWQPMPFKDFRIVLRAHMQLPCSVSSACINKFESIEKVMLHARCHTGSGFSCCECSVELPNWRRCSAHLWKTHQIDVDLLHCPECDYKSPVSVLIWRHMRVHKKWRALVLRSLRAVQRRRMENANKLKAQEPSEPAQPAQPPAVANKNKYYAEKTCEICNRKFVNGKTLSKHVKTVHNKIKPFICNVCGKKTARKASLIIHMRQHTGEKPLQCEKCKFSTRDPSVLYKHRQRHEPKQGTLKCSECDYSCIQANALKRHMLQNHAAAYRAMCCDLCNFTSINSAKLLAHKEDHRKGLITNCEDSMDASRTTNFKYPRKLNDKNNEASIDCFMPLESVDSLPHEPTVDTGGVTIPAPSEDTQFPTYLNS